MRDRSHSQPPPRSPIASPNKEQKFDWQALWQIERPALLAFRPLSLSGVLMRITQSTRQQTPTRLHQQIYFRDPFAANCPRGGFFQRRR